MKPIVIDASMAAAWSLEDERSEAGERILHEVNILWPITTSLFWHEYWNILVSNHKQGRVKDSDIPVLLDRINLVEIEERGIQEPQRVIFLALQYTLSAYDAGYLALALQEDAILTTNDRRLARAALSAGIEIRTTLEEERLR